jgi:hypothetical protein
MTLTLRVDQIVDNTSIFSKDIITPPFVPHGISLTCKKFETSKGTISKHSKISVSYLQKITSN